MPPHIETEGFCAALNFALLMECWNSGILGNKKGRRYFQVVKFLLTQHSITLFFQYAN
jgi:hypothetical protein